MRTLFVKFDDVRVVETLKEMGIVSYIPILYAELQSVVVKTDLSDEELLKIKGIVRVRESRTGTLFI